MASKEKAYTAAGVWYSGAYQRKWKQSRGRRGIFKYNFLNFNNSTLRLNILFIP